VTRQCLLQRLDARQSAASVIDSFQARTLRLNRSTTAARWMKPWDIEMEAMSMAQIWLGRSTGRFREPGRDGPCDPAPAWRCSGDGRSPRCPFASSAWPHAAGPCHGPPDAGAPAASGCPRTDAPEAARRSGAMSPVAPLVRATIANARSASGVGRGRS
jgi:hypothetical protein